jgi:hypothetical protein
LITLFSPICAKTKIDTADAIFSIGISAHHGFIFAHSRDVQNTRGANPSGVTLSAIWKLIGTKTWQKCACMPRMGVYVSFYDYDVQLLGQGYIASYFLEPDFKITKKLYANIRGSFGAAYLTNPYHAIDNPTNQSYSTPINLYGTASAGVRYQFTSHFGINVMGEYKHISNGGIKNPNKGINWPVLSVGIEYTLKPQNIPDHPTIENANSKKLRWSIFAFSGSKNIEVNDPRRYFIWGITGYLSKPFGRIHAFNFGLEALENFANKERLKRSDMNDRSQAVSLLVGHEFLLGKFTFIQQLGCYLYDPTPFYPIVYHRWGFNFYPTKHLVLGINLKAHYQVADFFDLRVGAAF